MIKINDVVFMKDEEGLYRDDVLNGTRLKVESDTTNPLIWSCLVLEGKNEGKRFFIHEKHLQESDEALADKYHDTHYNKLGVQPIEVMQAIMTHEEFVGFLKGNMLKYSMRCGLKDAESKERAKFERYKVWHEKAVKGEYIDPRVD